MGTPEDNDREPTDAELDDIEKEFAEVLTKDHDHDAYAAYELQNQRISMILTALDRFADRSGLEDAIHFLTDQLHAEFNDKAAWNIALYTSARDAIEGDA